MKKSFLFIAVGCLLAMQSCGEGKQTEANSDKESEAAVTTGSDDETSTSSMDFESSYSSSDNDSNVAEENDNQSNGWNPEGTYTFEDANGTEFTLIVKGGGSAVLKSSSSESKGSWSQNSSEGYVDLNFWEGPFVTIGSNDYIMDPVLTADHLYYDRSAYRGNRDYVDVKLVK